MADKIIALFVEGPTEIEFYKAVVNFIRKQNNAPFEYEFKWLDMKGIGNYKDDALRKFNNVKRAYPSASIFAMLCIDTDAFEFSRKPPIDKSRVKRALEKAGAAKVYYIEAKHSIEDWFLTDLAGVLTYLNLPRETRRPSGSGQSALKQLFYKANRVYVKGTRAEGLIAKLSIQKIMVEHCQQLNPLCKLLKIDCSVVCNKRNGLYDQDISVK